MSHLSRTSNMTTRAINQFPAAGLAPAGHAALRAASRGRREEKTTHLTASSEFNIQRNLILISPLRPLRLKVATATGRCIYSY
jgi:hypothetical protein